MFGHPRRLCGRMPGIDVNEHSVPAADGLQNGAAKWAFREGGKVGAECKEHPKGSRSVEFQLPGVPGSERGGAKPPSYTCSHNREQEMSWPTCSLGWP